MNKIKSIRKDWDLIESLVKYKSRILDIGCGEGDLIQQLEKNLEARVHGIEKSQELALKSISKGLNVTHGDAERDLNQFANQSFDYVILSQTLQAFYSPEKVLKDLLRVGKCAIVSIPNFGYWKVRTSLLLFGKMPVTKTLPYSWHNTPNLHMCTIKDMYNFCAEKNIKIDKILGLNGDRTSQIKKNNLEIKNLFSKIGIFVLS